MFIIFKNWIKFKFGETENEKHKLHLHKNPISIYNTDINKMLVPNKIVFGKRGLKDFISYKYGKKVKPSYVMLPKMSTY